MTNFIVDVQYKKILDSNGYSLPMILKKAKLPPDIFNFEPVTIKKNQYYNFCNALGEVLSDYALIKLAKKEKARIPHCFNTCSLNLTKGCQTWSLMSLYPARESLAIHYIKNTNLSVEEIAFLLSYSEINSFLCALKISNIKSGLKNQPTPTLDKEPVKNLFVFLLV